MKNELMTEKNPTNEVLRSWILHHLIPSLYEQIGAGNTTTLTSVTRKTESLDNTYCLEVIGLTVEDIVCLTSGCRSDQMADSRTKRSPTIFNWKLKMKQLQVHYGR